MRDGVFQRVTSQKLKYILAVLGSTCCFFSLPASLDLFRRGM